MPAKQIHLVRHGEVFNPQGVLYGRLPGYGLTDLGRPMAKAAADDLVARRRPVAAFVSSPLQRTQQSAEPIAAVFELEPTLDDRVIEPDEPVRGQAHARPRRRARDCATGACSSTRGNRAGASRSVRSPTA